MLGVAFMGLPKPPFAVDTLLYREPWVLQSLAQAGLGLLLFRKDVEKVSGHIVLKKEYRGNVK